MKKSVAAIKSVSLLAILFLFLTLIFSAAGYGQVRGDINNDDRVGLPEAINALQITAGIRPLSLPSTINVPGHFATIQAAVDAAFPGDTINVAAGTFVGRVSISGKKLTLQGAGSDRTIIDGGGAGNDVITVDGGQLIVITGITVKNGRNGVSVRMGASIELNDIKVEGAAIDGILVSENSTARIANCAVSGSGRYGIVIYGSSNAIFSGNIKSNNNTDRGIMISGSSNGRFEAAIVEVAGNGDDGIMIQTSSALIAANATSITASNNQRRGIIVLGGSLIISSTGPANTLILDGNKSHGISIVGASFAFVGPPNSLTSSNNTGYGILVSETASLESYGAIVLQNNSAGGMIVTLSSSAFLGGGAVSFLSNKQSGLIVMRTSVLVSSAAEIAVSGTTVGSGLGIGIVDNSVLDMRGKLTVENSSQRGVYVATNSLVRFGPASVVRIHSNSGQGVGIWANSGLFSDPNADVLIQNNTRDGISLGFVSQLQASGIKVQTNGFWGIHADDGSSVNITSSTINGNGTETTYGDIRLSFGSRSTLSGANTIGRPWTCEMGTSSRGDDTGPNTRCP